MFGFSLSKLLFTVLMVLAVWYGFKWVGRLQRQHELQARARAGAARKAGRPGAPPPAPNLDDDIEDTVRCRACGAYVPVRATRHCGRGDCPYPG